MGLKRPFYRTIRKLTGPNGGHYGPFVYDRDYAIAPEHYVRAFMIIQKDLVQLFEYIEPTDSNLETYSYRTHELFMRTCIETEANFKAILKANTFNPKHRDGRDRPEKKWNIHDYKKVNTSHHLSSYTVHIPIWRGDHSSFRPFSEWNDDQPLSWYQAYNSSKHDRHNSFGQANLRNLLNSISALLVLLSSQFGREEFSPAMPGLAVTGVSYYSTTPALGDFFHIDYPDDWEESELYDFTWRDIRDQPDKFVKFNYDEID